MIPSQDIFSTQRLLCFMEGEMLVLVEAQPMGEPSSVERDQPLYSVTLLHQRSLVHGPDPAIHVLLCVRTEEICPHPAVFCLWANHRVLIVNVGAHSCMARLSKRERDRGGEREDGYENFLLKTGKRYTRGWWVKNFAFLFTEIDSCQLSEDKVYSNIYWKKNSVGVKCCSRNNVNTVLFLATKKA